MTLSRAELQALDQGVDGDPAPYCSGGIKRLVDLLSRPPSDAARIQRQFIYLAARDDWWKVGKVRETLCRQYEDRIRGLICAGGHGKAILNGGGEG